MFLDEKLVQMELRRNAKEEGREEAERMEMLKEEILRQERDQKPISDFIRELKAGIVDIDGIKYLDEKQDFLNKYSRLYVFRDDVEQIIQNEGSVTVVYQTLGMAINLMWIHAPMVMKDEKEYQKKMEEQLKKGRIPYHPLDTGRLKSGETTICYASGITAGPIGNVLSIHFYYKAKEGFIVGSYTCELLKRYSFEHLFLAMLHLICEEED